MTEVLAIALFITICLTLILGYPVAFVLGGVSLLFAVIGKIGRASCRERV